MFRCLLFELSWFQVSRYSLSEICVCNEYLLACNVNGKFVTSPRDLKYEEIHHCTMFSVSCSFCKFSGGLVFHVNVHPTLFYWMSECTIYQS